MKGKRSMLMVSARIMPRSDKLETVFRRTAASERTGVMKSSEVMTRRNMQPNTARLFQANSDQRIERVRGYSIS